MKKIAAICPQCGGDFSYYPSAFLGKPKIHCSRKCQSEAAWLHKVCPQCGKPFICRRCEPSATCSRTCGKRMANSDKHITFNCDQCGEALIKKLSAFQGKGQKNHFCSLRCYGDWLAERERPDHRKRVKRVCKECNREFEITPSQLTIEDKNNGTFCDRACAARWHGKKNPSKGLVFAKPGDQNVNWKGGNYPKYYGPNWHEQRRAARKRDSYTCQRCSITEFELGIELDVHHIRRFGDFGIARYEEANHLNNLISLCAYCHLIVEPRGCTTTK